MTKKEELLIDWCKLLKMHKEAILVVMACLRTDRQTAGNNAGLAHETLSGEPIGGQDTSSS